MGDVISKRNALTKLGTRTTRGRSSKVTTNARNVSSNGGRTRQDVVPESQKIASTRWDKLKIARAPQLYLDERFRYPSSPSVPTLHFGIGFTKENILYCVNKRELLQLPGDQEKEDQREDASRCGLIALIELRKYLERKVKVGVFLEPVLAQDYLGVFSIYSNHNRHMHYLPDREREILNTLRRELDQRRQQAAWFWSTAHGLGYVSEYAEFNP